MCTEMHLLGESWIGNGKNVYWQDAEAENILQKKWRWEGGEAFNREGHLYSEIW